MELPLKMYQNYIQHRIDDLNELTKALTHSDFAPFRKIGHQLKGNATSFGFGELLPLANRMHDLNAQNILQQGPSIVEELKTWISSKKENFEIK